MADLSGSQPEPRLLSAEGSPVIVGMRDKHERIRESLMDLKLATDGYIAQQSDQSGVSGLPLAALARHCSVFLRKMVLEDRRTRLLDEDICREADLRFDRVRRVSEDRRTLTLVLDMRGGRIDVTRLNDETSEPEAAYTVPVGAQRLEFAIEWPLPGMADWTEEPTTESPWKMRPESLFDVDSESALGCDDWLGQQLVTFDGRGISLKEVFRLTVNTEGAHSPPTSRLMRVEGEEKSKVARNRDEVRILSHLRGGGIRFSHAVVIEAALYLFRELARSGSPWRPQGEVNMPVPCFVQSGVFSPEQNWLRFDGGLAISLGGAAQNVSHRVRAPG